MEEEKKELLKAWMKFKHAEEKAKKSRYEIEAKIAPLYQFSDSESKTFNEDDFKVNVKRGETFSLDQDAWKTARLSIPDDIRPEKIKFELDKAGFTWLKENNADVYKIVSDCVTKKPSKVSINIEKI